MLVVAGRTGWYSLPGYVLLVAGVYVLIRTVVDRTRSVAVTGQVLAPHLGGRGQPHLDYLVVDDGTAERTTAWGLPASGATAAGDGDVVTITARPWSRRVVAVTRHSPGGPARRRAEPARWSRTSSAR